MWKGHVWVIICKVIILLGLFIRFGLIFDGIAENYFGSGSSIGIVHAQGTKLNQKITQGDYEILLTRKP